jgi:hypothetical protein
MWLILCIFVLFHSLWQTLASSPDVRVVLERRFDMMNWFKRHGYPDSVWQQRQHEPELPAARATAAVAARTTGHVTHAAPSDLQVVVEDAEPGPPLLVFDFDKTLTDWDAGGWCCYCFLLCQLKLVMSLTLLPKLLAGC